MTLPRATEAGGPRRPPGRVSAGPAVLSDGGLFPAPSAPLAPERGAEGGGNNPQVSVPSGDAMPPSGSRHYGFRPGRQPRIYRNPITYRGQSCALSVPADRRARDVSYGACRLAGRLTAQTGGEPAASTAPGSHFTGPAAVPGFRERPSCPPAAASACRASGRGRQDRLGPTRIAAARQLPLPSTIRPPSIWSYPRQPWIKANPDSSPDSAPMVSA